MAAQSSYDRRIAAGTVRLDKHRIERFVSLELMPEIEAWLEGRAEQTESIGTAHRIAQGVIEIESARAQSRAYPHEETIMAHVQVTSNPSPSRHGVVGGGVTETHQERNGDISIGVQAWLNANLTPEYYLKFLMRDPHGVEQVQYGLYSVLIHELTHAAEAIFPRRRQYDPENLDHSRYYNDPKEVRAFMQQVVDEVLYWASHEVLRRHVKGNNQRLVERALQLSPTWREIDQFLTPANKRRILSAVYGEVSRRDKLFP